MKNTLIDTLKAEIAKKEVELSTRYPKNNRSPGIGPVSAHGLFHNTIQLSESFDEKTHPDEIKEREEEYKQPSTVSIGIRAGGN
jgi:hypothetical protein